MVTPHSTPFTASTIEALTLLILGLLITALRTYARAKRVGFRNFQADDYLVLVGIFFYCIETSIMFCVVLAQGLANNSMTDAQRAALSPDSLEYQLRVKGSMFQICGWLSYVMVLWSLKFAMCTFFLRMTSGLYEHRKRMMIGFILLGVTWMGLLLDNFLACRPFHHMWQINPNPGILCQPAISPPVIWGLWVADVGTDLYIMSIPIPILFRAALPLRKRIALCSLFACGFFVITASTVRVSLIASDPVNGPMNAGSWAVRATIVAVITTNMPIIFPLIKQWMKPIVGSIGDTLTRSKKSTTERGPPHVDTIGGGSSGKNRGPRTVYPIPNTTFNNSQEHILDGMVRLRELGKDGNPVWVTPIEEVEVTGTTLSEGGSGASEPGTQAARSRTPSADEGKPPPLSRASEEEGECSASRDVGEAKEQASLGRIHKRVDIVVENVERGGAPSSPGTTYGMTWESSQGELGDRRNLTDDKSTGRYRRLE